MDAHRRHGHAHEDDEGRQHRHRRAGPRARSQSRSTSPWMRRWRQDDQQTPPVPSISPMPMMPLPQPTMPTMAVALPYNARPLCWADYAACQPVFAHYLALQKGLCLADLSEAEARHRWRIFVGRWNRRALPQGWYQPQMSLRVVRAQTGQGEHAHTCADDAALLHSESEDEGCDEVYGEDCGQSSVHDYRAEHYARLEELLPRTNGRRTRDVSMEAGPAGESPPDTADEGDYRRMLAALQRRRQQTDLVVL